MSMPLLTFVIPVRHPDNSPDWGLQCDFLSATAHSIAGQQDSNWRAVVVANKGSDLPPLPQGFTVEWVDFEPNRAYSMREHGKAAARDAFRLDKGRRVLAGMLAAPDSSHFMIVDDDDFVSNRLAGFVARNPEKPGWYIDRGYGWTEGSDYCVAIGGYSHVCGSSLLIRADLYELPGAVDEADDDFIKSRLGSHLIIKQILSRAGTPLSPLPFPGGIYRVGHANSHSNSGNLWQYFFLNPKYLVKPLGFLKNVFGLGRLSPSLRTEFMGQHQVGSSV